jgi:hypothetical protein
MFRKALLILMAFIVINANANTTTGKVKRIYPTGDRIYFRIHGDTCATSSQYYYFDMDETSERGRYAARNWYTMLLASAQTGKPISVKVNSCPAEGPIYVSYIYQDF